MNFWIILHSLPLKIVPLAISVSRKALSNDKIANVLGHRLHSSNFVLELKHKISRTLSSRVKLFNGFCLKNPKKDPSVEKFGLNVNG